MSLIDVMENDVAAVFDEIGHDASYNGDAIKVLPGRTTLITDGSVRELSRVFIVMVADVSSPEPGDVIEFGQDLWTVSDPGGEPISGGRGIWTVQTLKQRRPTFRG
jgi:hypothetical protein